MISRKSSSETTKTNSPSRHRRRSSWVGLEGLRLRKAETMTLVSRTARSRSVTGVVPVDGGALGNDLLADLFTQLHESSQQLPAGYVPQ